MGWEQSNGRLNDWPESVTAPLYWTILTVTSKKEYKQEHVINEQTGSKLYTDGTDAIEPYDPGKDFLMSPVKYCEWNILVGAYYSHDEAQEFICQGVEARDTKVFKFTEKQAEMFEFAGSPLKALYKHPLLIQQIPVDWVPDI